MHIGTQIAAPEGWKEMFKGVTYHFLKSDAKRGRVLLVLFQTIKTWREPSKSKNTTKKNHYSATLLVMSRHDFEEGLSSENIVQLEKQNKLPPWLQQLEGKDLVKRDNSRANPKFLHSARVEDRFLQIAPTVRDFESVLAADDPEKEINRRAKLCVPVQNESRYRLWVLTYLCFGRDMWMLLPPFHVIGHWDRCKYPERKFGAPSLAFGRNYGNGSSKELTKTCVESYRKRAKLGNYMTSIYHDTMTEDFHCKVLTAPSGMKYYVQPEGKPFPTFGQFTYRVKQAIGIDQIQKTLYGAVRHRSKIAASKGAFSEEVSNLMEIVEADGYYTEERPQGYIEGSSLPPLCVVTSRDLLSGKKLGIGFSFGSERSEAYRMMLFCMAVPKDYFCGLWGIPFVPGEWSNEGLPPHFSIDRGPGARKDLIEEFEKRFPIKGLAPSWMGQSKATVESSHPKDMHIDGQPTYIQSELTPVKLAKREIMRLILFNNTANMEGRIDPDSDLIYVVPSPNGYWEYYDKIFRNDASPISIADAVRMFLTPVEFSLKDNGVWLDQRWFDSDELRTTGILERVARSGKDGSKINGYMMDLNLRQVWVEVDGKIIQVNAKLRIRGDEETLDMSFEELKQWGEERRKVQSEFRTHQQAATSDIHDRFKENTGKSWDNGKRRSGKPTRDATQRQEEAEVKQGTSKRKAA